MIVKNEAGVLERCFGTCRGLMDYWVICDTGSTDGTQDLIRSRLSEVPGEIHERPWVNFGHNRSELMELARGKADYLLLLDADMTVTYDDAGLRDLRDDAYMLLHAGATEYRIKRLVRGSRKWWYVGATHEYLTTTEEPETVKALDAIVIHHHADSGTQGEKFERDLRLLTEDLERDQDNPRTVFYLAQTFRDLGRIDEAVALYRRRAEMGGWEEEVFYSLYQVGVLEARREDWPVAIEALITAWNYRPQRIEPLYELAWILRDREQYHAAHTFAELGQGTQAPGDWLFVERWIYDWGLLFEYSISAYWCGKFDACIKACKRLLKIDTLPESNRLQTRRNMEFALREKARDAVERMRPPKGLAR
jgi:tetratricopeptide (TPR) repeat protein